jgi:hypothetical protein
MEKSDIQTLSAYGKKFINSQNDPIVMVSGATYRNIDLLAIYKINMMCELAVIDEKKKEELLDLYHKNLLLEGMFYSEKDTDKANAIGEKLKKIHGILDEYYLLPEDLDLDYLVYGSIVEENEVRLKKTIEL